MSLSENLFFHFLQFLFVSAFSLLPTVIIHRTYPFSFQHSCIPEPPCLCALSNLKSVEVLFVTLLLPSSVPPPYPHLSSLLIPPPPRLVLSLTTAFPSLHSVSFPSPLCQPLHIPSTPVLYLKSPPLLGGGLQLNIN